jgi:hypothetical protein
LGSLPIDISLGPLQGPTHFLCKLIPLICQQIRQVASLIIVNFALELTQKAFFARVPLALRSFYLSQAADISDALDRGRRECVFK